MFWKSTKKKIENYCNSASVYTDTEKENTEYQALLGGHTLYLRLYSGLWKIRTISLIIQPFH